MGSLGIRPSTEVMELLPDAVKLGRRNMDTRVSTTD